MCGGGRSKFLYQVHDDAANLLSIFGVLFPRLQHGSKVFAYFYGMFNIYVLLLAFCYTPAGSIYGDINTNDNVSWKIGHRM